MKNALNANFALNWDKTWHLSTCNFLMFSSKISQHVAYLSLQSYQGTVKQLKTTRSIFKFPRLPRNGQATKAMIKHKVKTP